MSLGDPLSKWTIALIRLLRQQAIIFFFEKFNDHVSESSDKDGSIATDEVTSKVVVVVSISRPFWLIYVGLPIVYYMIKARLRYKAELADL